MSTSEVLQKQEGGGGKRGWERGLKVKEDRITSAKNIIQKN